jgi:hypothetical protein
MRVIVYTRLRAGSRGSAHPLPTRPSAMARMRFPAAASPARRGDPRQVIAPMTPTGSAGA